MFLLYLPFRGSKLGEKAYFGGRGADLEVLSWDEIVTPSDVVQVGKSAVGSFSMVMKEWRGRLYPGAAAKMAMKTVENCILIELNWLGEIGK